MLECVLSIACTETHLAQETDKFGMNAVYTDFQCGGFSFFLDPGFYLTLCLTDHLLDPGRMNSAVDDQLFKRDTCNFAANRVKSRNNNRFRCIIDNQIDACHRLKSTNIASFTSDDPALHFISGQLDDRNRSFRNMICRTALYGIDHIFFCPFFCFFFRFRLNFFDHPGGIQFHFIFNNF